MLHPLFSAIDRSVSCCSILDDFDPLRVSLIFSRTSPDIPENEWVIVSHIVHDFLQTPFSVIVIPLEKEGKNSFLNLVA
jgi:hypothetical protein